MNKETYHIVSEKREITFFIRQKETLRKSFEVVENILLKYSKEEWNVYSYELSSNYLGNIMLTIHCENKKAAEENE